MVSSDFGIAPEQRSGAGLSLLAIALLGTSTSVYFGFDQIASLNRDGQVAPRDLPP